VPRPLFQDDFLALKTEADLDVLELSNEDSLAESDKMMSDSHQEGAWDPEDV
jgi:hypothetical protein